MSGITHNQAVKWIHRSQDGLLNEGQQSLLEEHLHSCVSCRPYAEEMERVSAHLQDEFHRRWDRSVGPSQYITEMIMSKARKIPVANRISSSVRVVAGAMALLLLAVAINLVVSRLQSPPPTATDATETIDNSFLPEDRLLAFTSSQNGNSDIYTMHADGSGLTNITNHPAHDIYPFWSPDGKQIAFMSDRDGYGSPHIYLMNTDGSNVIQLTQGEGKYLLDVNGYTPWSPDGRKLLYSYQPSEETHWNLYVLDISNKSSTMLTREPGNYILPSWSPAGKHVAFVGDTDRIYRDLFLVDIDGTQLIRLTENLQAGEVFLFDYDWSEDGTSLFLTTSRNEQSRTHISTVYEAHMDGSLSLAAEVTDRLIVDWWNGVAVLQQEEPRLSWLRLDGSTSPLDVCQAGSHKLGTAHKRSQSGDMAFASNCSDSGWMLFWANSDGTTTDQLLDFPVAGEEEILFQLNWSPDDRYLAFVSSSIAAAEVTSTLYVLDVEKAREDPSIQPLKMTNSSGLSWQPSP